MIDLFDVIKTISILWLILDWSIRILSVFIVPRNRRPSASLAWLMLIFLIPTLGFLLFIIIGNPKLPLSRRQAQENLDDSMRQTTNQLRQRGAFSDLEATNISKNYAHVAQLSNNLTGLSPLKGNSISVLSDYDEILKSIVRDIDQAKKYIQLEYYIVAFDSSSEQIIEALGRAVKRGVDTRVLYDWWASMRTPGYKKMRAALDSHNILHLPILPFRPPGWGYVRPDLRNHRKLIAIDGRCGYVGSQNLIQRNYHRKDELYYDEVVSRIEGPVVLQLSAVFISDWYAETGKKLGQDQMKLTAEDVKPRGDSVAQILPSGPGYDDENNLKVFTAMIHAAKKSITIVNPYFVPDEALMTAITSAAQRGVQVTMINSEAIDQWLVAHAQRSFYEELLKDGVQLYLYNSPILLHSKYITIDDEVAIIGSSNLDIRSFLLALEVTMINYDHQVVAQLNKVTTKYLKNSRPISLKQWQARPPRLLLLDNIARLTAALQ